MSAGPVVSNSSPLIALQQIGMLEALRELFVEVLVPPGVVSETSPTVTLPSWVKSLSPSSPIAATMLSATLGLGESEAIALAVETAARLIILDDRPARRAAEALGLNVIGTLGILLASKRRGLIPAIRPLLDDLITKGFRIAKPLYEQACIDAGE